MSDMVAEQGSSVSKAQRYLPALVLLFIGSGCAALIYEVVWFQILELVVGASSVSLGILLGTFMGGMCVGSLLAPRLISRKHHPLKVYAYLEIGIGILGLLILLVVPLVGSLYTAWAGSGMASMILRGIVAGVCLLPPTFLMGATLPAISRWVETTREGVSWLGFFYGGNIAGAVGGSLLAGYYLLRVYDVAIATFVAVAINITVALLGLYIAKLTPYDGAPVTAKPTEETKAATEQQAENWPVYVTICLSGFAALACQVVWTRLLALLFGATVYTFSLVLAAFLFGLGIGSSVGAAVARNTRKPREALGWCQLALCAAIAWAAYQTMLSMPWWPVNVELSYDLLAKVQLDMVRAMWAILPASILWGASFPLALASVSARGQDAGKVVGAVYAANTLGAIFGAMLASFTFVSAFGMQGTQQGLIGVSAIAGLLMLALAPEKKREELVDANAPSHWSFQGRIGRSTFWQIQLVLLFAGLATYPVALISNAVNPGPMGVVLVILILIFAVVLNGLGAWLGLAAIVKRWHDLGRSGWLALLNLTFVAIPIVLVILGFRRGTQGPNRYGAAPGTPGFSAPPGLGFALMVLFAMALSGTLVVTVPELDRNFVAYGRFAPTRAGRAEVVYVGEGRMGLVAVSKLSDGTLNYHNAGKIQASSDPADMRLQRMLGHLTTLVPAQQRNFLVIGFGAGATAGAVSIEPKLEHETIVEIEPLVPEFVSKHFSDHNFKVAENPKVTVRIDDGRHFLFTTDQKFDGITSDPLDPWVKGAAALYTKEFFEAAKAHLNPGGVVTQFVQLYESSEEAVKSEISTFFEVFPDGMLFVNNINGSGYDLVMLGQAGPTMIDVDALSKKLESPEYAQMAQSLRDIGFYSAQSLLATWAGAATDFSGWTKDAIINYDSSLRLQYLAGLGLNMYRANDIYQKMVAYGPRMPQGRIFTGSATTLEQLGRLIDSGQFR